MISSVANTDAKSRRVELPDPARVRAAKIQMLDAGQKATEWAVQNNEDRWLVHKVLSGQRPCTSGASHRIAVKLGILDNANA